MKKILLLIVILVFCFTSFSFAEESLEENKVKDLIMDIHNKSVTVFSIGSVGVGFCTGVVIKNESDLAYVLTAKHCIDVYEEVYVENNIVSQIIVSTDDDLALLITKKYIDDKTSAKLATKNSKWNNFVFHLGFPKSEVFIQAGITWIRSFDHQYYKLIAISGCSGGGIFNETSELVGILWGSIGEGVAISEPISDVKRFLKEANIQF